METVEPLGKVRRVEETSIKLIESSRLVGAERARAEFKVRGKGMRAAVLDSGLYSKHMDFDDKEINGYDCHAASDEACTYLNDESGHGTYVAGILAANGSKFLGIAPAADLTVVKILKYRGYIGSLREVACGLRWVRQNHERLGINVVALAYSTTRNHVTSDDALASVSDQLRQSAFDVKEEIERLCQARIPVVVGAGNGYNGREGMGYPAILESAVSVSGVNDADLRPADDQAADDKSVRIVRAPEDGVIHFAQRLHEDTNPREFTTVLAPGATVNATGRGSVDAVAALAEGTSAATPIVAGAILLMQELHYRLVGDWPEVRQIVKWLRSSAKIVADDCYNCVFTGGNAVVPTGKNYPRLQIDEALRVMQAELTNDGAIPV